jgi:hypothetical protein
MKCEWYCELMTTEEEIAADLRYMRKQEQHKQIIAGVVTLICLSPFAWLAWVIFS